MTQLVRMIAMAAALCFAVPSIASTVINLDDDPFPDGNFSDGVLNRGDVATSEDNSISIRFEQVVSGFPSGPARRRALVDGDGIYFSNEADAPGVVRVDLYFSTGTIIEAYDVDFERVRRGGFVLRAPDGSRTGRNRLSRSGEFTFDMGDISYFSANVPYRLTHNLRDADDLPFGFSQIDEFTVTEAPLPLSGVLLVGGLGALALCRRRQLC